MQSSIIYIIPILIATVFGIQPKDTKNAPQAIVEASTATPAETDEPPQRTLTTEEMIIKEFGESSPTALKVAKCESSLRADAKNSGSTASGLFQITKGTFEDNSPYPWSERFDAKKNIETAKIIFDHRKWQPWESSSNCWSK